MAKKDCIIISVIPKKHSWVNHCKYYYDEETFLMMDKDFDIIEFKYENTDNGTLI